jgi:hypothetical protein
VKLNKTLTAIVFIELILYNPTPTRPSPGNQTMVFYEVNLTVSKEIENQYLAWIPGHLQDMLQFEGFNKVNFSEELPLDSNTTFGNTRKFTVLFEVESHAHLQDYLQNHAARMRQEGIEKFGDKFSAFRRVFNLLRSEKK